MSSSRSSSVYRVRVANRIARRRFTFDDRYYQVSGE
jgi:galactose mutarotase-like enzyme